MPLLAAATLALAWGRVLPAVGVGVVAVVLVGAVLAAVRHAEVAVERGPGFVTGSVVDPFGDVLGVMDDRHYLDMLAAPAVDAG